MSQSMKDETLSQTTLTAFGVRCSTRYARVEEMSAMLGFLCELSRMEDGERLIGFIKGIFYDSKADMAHIHSVHCYPAMDHPSGWLLHGCSETGTPANPPPQGIMEAAMNRFPQTIFDEDDAVLVSTKVRHPA